ncbi:MAG: hypothetical protein IJO03_06490 [Clostridia bacterium]|nr:hypothetical protein [Clostridia bacterium]
MSQEELVVDFLKVVLEKILALPSGLIYLTILYGQGSFFLFSVFSFKRKSKKFVFNPLLAIPCGFLFLALVFVLENLDLISQKTLSVDVFIQQAFMSLIISTVVSGVISVVTIAIKEIFYYKDGGYNAQQK